MLKTYSNELRGWWNNADPTFSHISYTKWLKSEDDLVKGWKSTWIHRMPTHIGHVAEYGIGGGLLGKVLLTKHNVTHYTGLDISDRQINEARKRLDVCCKKRFTLTRVSEHLNKSVLQGVDTFVSQAVIQHFPSDKYTEDFLQVLNDQTSIRWMMLQVREFNKRDQGKSIVRAQATDRQTLQRYLPTFQMTWHSHKHQNGYVFYVFERR